ncbi:LysR family transcriptional regulator [Streptomyces platensis]|uniref:LysR family transcriptional regulator n=1 Tax=Streptomyces platensis TaxID=58346 RepID=UPI002257C619|nr:LysR family transcriptional regulator [Streptomyces platensis]MCX4637526.1 LysR family transcriptional regulator [Streptomyces platensis]
MNTLCLRRLQIFVAVVECGGFSAAARKLYMSQPSVSNQVRRLEASLQTTLIDRSGARIRLTAKGETFLSYAQRLMPLVEEALIAVQLTVSSSEPRLRVATTNDAAAILVPSVLARLTARIPGLRWDIHTGGMEQVTQQLIDGVVGMALLDGEPSAPGLVIEPILSERLVLVVGGEHPLAGRQVTAEDVATKRLLLRESGSATRGLQNTALRRWNIQPVDKGEVWGNEALKLAVSAGLGASLMSWHCVAQEVRDGRLALVDLVPALPSHPIVMAHLLGRKFSCVEEAFAQLLFDLKE